MRVHDESKSFKCDVCLKVFPCKAMLKTHYRTHTGEKPFACQLCGKKFAHKSTLVQHQATHSDVKNFKCSICPDGRCFKTKNQLSQHMAFHYEPKFSCSYCDHKSYTKMSLEKHIETHFRKWFVF